jgi:hypothetical protein
MTGASTIVLKWRPGDDDTDRRRTAGASTLAAVQSLGNDHHDHWLINYAGGFIRRGFTGELLLLFAVIWWMYSGYVWLTNEVAPSTPARRTVLVAGMFGFFTLALAVPDAVHGHGVVFGWAFLGVTLVHAVLFRVSGSDDASAAILRILPTNLAAAICMVVGGYARQRDIPPGGSAPCW